MLANPEQKIKEVFITQKGQKCKWSLNQVFNMTVPHAFLALNMKNSLKTDEHYNPLCYYRKRRKCSKSNSSWRRGVSNSREEWKNVAKSKKNLKQRYNLCNSQQKQIRDRVFKFEKFLKENDAKRQRANLKAQTEKKIKEQKEQELGALQKGLENENLKSKNILKMISEYWFKTEKYQIYERYLQSAVDILPADYLDVNERLLRV